MEHRKRFARNLRKRRVESRLSQEALASRARLHRTEISLLERGDRDPRLSTVVRLAAALEIDPAALLENLEGRGRTEPRV